MRIAIYSRKSVETDTGESIKNQIKLCKEYFNKQYKNCTFEIFEDEGFSGGNTNRPSFQRMMELVKIKQFDIVAVYKIDRIARNIVDFVNVYDELDRLGIQLVSVTEGFDPSTPIGKMMMLLLASFAEMERMNIAQRVKDNMRELAKIGRWSGGTPPTGYETVKVKENDKTITYLQLMESEKYNIIEIFEKYSQGYSTYKISKDFEDKGLKYPHKTISNILVNPTYLISTPESVQYLESQGYTVYGKPNGYGFLPYNRRPRIKGKKSWNDKSKFVGVSMHEAIIDLELWTKTQEVIKKKATDPRPRESEFTWLTGLVKCRCGAGMYVQAGKQKKNGDKIYYFRCLHKKGSCNNKFLRVDYAEKYVLEYMHTLLDKDFLKECIGGNEDKKAIQSKIKLIDKKIAANTMAINNLIDKLMLLSNEASLAVTSKIDELSKQNNKLKEEVLMLERKRLLDELSSNNIDAAYNNIKKFLNSGDNIELRKRHLKSVVEYFIWDYDKYTLGTKLLKF